MFAGRVVVFDGVVGGVVCNNRTLQGIGLSQGVLSQGVERAVLSWGGVCCVERGGVGVGSADDEGEPGGESDFFLPCEYLLASSESLSSSEMTGILKDSRNSPHKIGPNKDSLV